MTLFVLTACLWKSPDFEFKFRGFFDLTNVLGFIRIIAVGDCG